MRKGTREFREARAAGAEAVTVVDVLVDDDVVASNRPEQPQDSRIRILGDPRIVHDASRKVVSTISAVSLQIPDELVPRSTGNSALASANKPIYRISSGYRWNGQVETVPVGVFQQSNIVLENNGAGREVTATLVDLAAEMKLAPFWKPMSIPSGANRLELARDFLARVYPDLEINSPDIDIPVAAFEIEEDNKILDIIIDKLLRPINHHFYFDATGKPQIVPPFSAEEDPVLTFSSEETGDPKSRRFLKIRRGLPRDGMYNGFIMRVESTREADENGDTPEPFYAEAWADYVPSPMGYSQSMAEAEAPGAFPRIEISQTLTSQDDVNVATRLGANVLSLQPENVVAEIGFEPGLEVRDVIDLSDESIGLQGRFVIGKLERGLGPGPMNLSMYERRSGASAYFHSPNGADGHLAALGVTETKERDSISTRIGVVTAIDRSGRPPIYEVDGIRRMRYLSHSELIEVGDRVLWIPNGGAPYIEGTLAGPEAPTATPTSDWFYTGDAAANHPAIGFRFWQGNADPRGEALFDIGFDPEDVILAHVNSPQWISMSQQWARPVTITADGKAKITGMRPGAMFKLTTIVKNDTPPGGTPTYDYIATGNNEEGTPAGDHPILAVYHETGTLNSIGWRTGGGTGISPARFVAAHARVMVDGESRDLSLFSQHDRIYQTHGSTRVTTSGAIQGKPEFANKPYSLTIIYSAGSERHPVTPGASTLITDYLGKDNIGTQPEFQLLTFDTTFEGGNAWKPTGVDLIEHRGAAVLGTGDGYVVSAEMYSESQNRYRLADPLRGRYTHGKPGIGLVFLLKGSDTAQPVT